MTSSDITIIFLTPNKVPKKWAEFHKEKLIEAAGDAPIITISREPLDWGINLLQTEPYGISNIYFQLLRGAKKATTDYIALAEDDTLYPKKHFQYRPPFDTFAYNKNKLGLFTWGYPVYYRKVKITTNCTLVAPRKLTIEALEERFEKYLDGVPQEYCGELGKPKVEDNLGLTRHKSEWFSTEIPIINIDHEYGLDYLSKIHRKKLGMRQYHDIPYWGRAEELIKKFE